MWVYDTSQAKTSSEDIYAGLIAFQTTCVLLASLKEKEPKACFEKKNYQVNLTSAVWENILQKNVTVQLSGISETELILSICLLSSTTMVDQQQYLTAQHKEQRKTREKVQYIFSKEFL